jgi:hypothetical protein
MKNLYIFCLLLSISVFTINAAPKPEKKIPSLPKPISIMGHLKFVGSNQTLHVYKCIAPFNRACARIYKVSGVGECGASFPETSFFPFSPEQNKQYIGVMDSNDIWNYFEQNTITVICPKQNEKNTDIKIIINIPIALQ